MCREKKLFITGVLFSIVLTISGCVTTQPDLNDQIYAKKNSGDTLDIPLNASGIPDLSGFSNDIDVIKAIASNGLDTSVGAKFIDQDGNPCQFCISPVTKRKTWCYMEGAKSQYGTLLPNAEGKLIWQ